MASINDRLAGRLPVDPLVPFWLVVPVVAWIGHGFTNGVTRDVALYVYAGQAVADGEPPYVAVMNRAGPLAHLLPGLGVALGRLVGVADVTGARLLYFALAVLTPVLVYLVVRTVHGSRLAASVGAAAMVSYPIFAHFSTSGPDSKQPMVVFLALALALVVQRRMLAAGVATALATLTWQPVLFTAGAAALVMALTAGGGWRGRLTAMARYAVGGLVTLAATVAYFAAVGAFSEFLDGFWRANAYHRQPPLLGHWRAVWSGLDYWYGWRLWLLLGGLLLSVLLAGWLLVRRPADDSRLAAARPGVLALGAATACAVGWSFYAFNAAPDSLLLLPVAAAGLGSGAALLVQQIATTPVRLRALTAAVAGFVLVVVATTAQQMISTRSSNLLLGQRGASAVYDELPDDVTSLSIGVPQPLALAGRRSVSRYVLHSAGMAQWIDAEWPGGLPAYVAWLRDQEADVLFTPPGPMPELIRPLDNDYFPVGRTPTWRVYLHMDVDEAVRERVDRALTTRRKARRQGQ